jgi:hypothetical protein
MTDRPPPWSSIPDRSRPLPESRRTRRARAGVVVQSQQPAGQQQRVRLLRDLLLYPSFAKHHELLCRIAPVAHQSFRRRSWNQRADVFALKEFDCQVEIEVVGPSGDLAVISNHESSHHRNGWLGSIGGLDVVEAFGEHD